MLTMTIIRSVCLLLCLLGLGASLPVAMGQHMRADFTPTVQIGGSDLEHSSSAKVYIRNFTLSPEGTTLAILYERGDSQAKGLWLALFDLNSRRVTNSIQMELEPTPNSYLAAGQTQSVQFTSDGGYLIVKGVEFVSVLDTKHLALLRKFSSSDHSLAVPMRCEMNTNGSVLLIAYGAGSTFSAGFHNERREVSSDRLVAEWSSSGLMQSLSPDGKLVVAPDLRSYNAGGVAALEVLKADDGTPVKSIDTGFAFKNRRPNESGSFIAAFTSDGTIAVSPDNMVDHSGRRSGSSIAIIDVLSGKVTRSLTATRFVPTGELIMSPDLKYFATVGLAADEKAIRVEKKAAGLSSGLKILIGNENAFPVAELGELDSYGLISSQLLPCLSSDARVLAVAQDTGIKVYRRE